MTADDRQIVDRLRGKFIVFDGPDGCGKTTQRQLLADHLAELGLRVTQCRDPGGTVIGDRIRSVLLDYDLSEMDVRCEAFLFMASRAQLVHEVIAPALTEDKVVLCDRFISSTCAYQGAAGYDVQRVIELGRYAVGDHWPDLTFVLDVPIEQGFDRTGRKPHEVGKHRRKHSGQGTMFDGARPDAMEARPVDFHRKVREIFLGLDALYPKPVVVIDATAETETVHRNIVETLRNVDL